MSEPKTTTVDVNGHPCRVWTKGSGPKIGFLAGFGGLPRWIPFLDRLAERFTAILAGVISSRVEGLQAVAQAEQQSHLEDLARKYEAEGKAGIAQSLRDRAARMTSSNLAGEALEVFEAVGGEPLKLAGSGPAASLTASPAPVPAARAAP